MKLGVVSGGALSETTFRALSIADRPDDEVPGHLCEPGAEGRATGVGEADAVERVEEGFLDDLLVEGSVRVASENDRENGDAVTVVQAAKCAVCCAGIRIIAGDDLVGVFEWGLS